MNERLLRSSVAEHRVAADLASRGYGLAWPTSHGLPFDLVLVRPDLSLERIQVKHGRSDGRRLVVKCASTSSWVQYSYRPEMVDWIAVWDESTDTCFYLPIREANLRAVTLRLSPTGNGQVAGVRWADDYRAI